MNLRFEQEQKRERRMKIVKEIIWFLLAVIIVIVFAWLIVRFALKKVSVIGSAMETTLYNGEDVIVNKTSYVLFPPKRDAVIAFYPEQEEGDTMLRDDSIVLIRRVIATPGEKVQIKEGNIYIDGEVIKEKYSFSPMVSAGVANSEITLGEDEYFVLSDNRNDMDDSRNASFTKVKKENIIGKVILTIQPFSVLAGPETNEAAQQKEAVKEDE